ncbi:Las1-like-domain-containing protein [Syncephalastrum racemosum]|uniref:Las1-like-domain-containing protein n=1 Tax=Syncephalastrum racemosum TaxID=13706 RepID=A0A1X2HEN1_SYNRA|nr:Las1-like-domain-containing protein [Syncephalastrum racemosum]
MAGKVENDMWLANQRGVLPFSFCLPALFTLQPHSSISMRGAYFVPWTNRDELKQVFNWLYSDINDSPDLVQLGLNRVQAWQSRGRLPHPIWSTAAFVQALMRDHARLLSGAELQLQYCMTIVRFVNGYVDRHSGFRYSAPVIVLARQVGLPDWFVDLRHAATHGELPTLPCLREAAHQALVWLLEKYWEREVKVVDSEAAPSNTDRTVKDLLNAYKDIRKTALKQQPAPRRTSELEQIMTQLGELANKTALPDIIALLLHPGGLVPLGKSKRSKPESMTLPQSLSDLWTPLLQSLSVSTEAFSKKLISELLDVISCTSDLRKNLELDGPAESEESTKQYEDSYLATAAAWLKYIVADTRNDRQPRLLRGITFEDIIGMCLHNPNQYTKAVLMAMKEADPLLGEQIDAFLVVLESMDAAEAKHGTAGGLQEDWDADMERVQKQLAEVESAIASFPDEHKKEEAAEDIAQMETDEMPGSTWMRLDETNWSPCPIGMLPGGVMPKLDLSPSTNPFVPK